MAENLTHHNASATPEHPYGLTPQQAKAVQSLLSERDVRSVAKAAKVSERTLHRWMSSPGFALAMRDAEAEALDGATRRLISLQATAADVLQELMEDTTAPEGVRLRAATSAMELLIKLRELRDVEGRLLALETAMLHGRPS